MHKIYSRKRLIIPSLKNTNKTSLKSRKYIIKFSKTSTILVIAFLVLATSLRAVSPVFDSICKDEAKSIATKITNEEATNVMREYSYEDLFSIEKDESGNITMIKSNVFPINEIISSIAIKIQEDIDSLGRNDIKIALGTFSGLKILSGRGPNVNIRISSIGNVETDLKSEFVEQGINQTLHRVYLQINCEINILTPFTETKESITNQVLIAENIIVGHIPTNYYNLEGVNKSNVTDIIK